MLGRLLMRIATMAGLAYVYRIANRWVRQRLR